jgi:hypothetical protein
MDPNDDNVNPEPPATDLSAEDILPTDQPVEHPALTFGEKAVGLSFNPAGNADVQEIKERCAGLIDKCNTERNLADDPDVKRMYSVAITEIQTAQMWAVKAATWGL